MDTDTTLPRLHHANEQLPREPETIDDFYNFDWAASVALFFCSCRRRLHRDPEPTHRSYSSIATKESHIHAAAPSTYPLHARRTRGPRDLGRQQQDGTPAAAALQCTASAIAMITLTEGGDGFRVHRRSSRFHACFATLRLTRTCVGEQRCGRTTSSTFARSVTLCVRRALGRAAPSHAIAAPPSGTLAPPMSCVLVPCACNRSG